METNVVPPPPSTTNITPRFNEVCESCGAFIPAEANERFSCSICKVVPYCSMKCKVEFQTKHSARDCLGPPEKIDWVTVRKQLGIDETTPIPCADLPPPSLDPKDPKSAPTTPVLILPGPITVREGEILPKAMRVDSHAIAIIDRCFAEKSISGDRSNFHYVVRYRDLPRVFIRQLNERQRGEMREIQLKQLKDIARKSKEQVAQQVKEAVTTSQQHQTSTASTKKKTNKKK